MRRLTPRWLLFSLYLLAASAAVACGGDDDNDARSLTVYSGRGKALVEPIFQQFEADTGIDLRVRYGETAELAVTILEEGDRSPAYLFFAQDAGALGALEEVGVLVPLPGDLLQRVDAKFRSAAGAWVGVSGRARVLVYSTARLAKGDLPASLFDLTDPRWQGRVGWAPTNGSFQAFVTAMRRIDGEARTAAWLRALQDNDVREYPGNSAIVQAVGDGEIDLGLVNHYYLSRFLAEDPGFPAANHATDPGGAGALINVAGVGLLRSARNSEAALRFIDYLLQPKAQAYFGGPAADDGFEYPLIQGVPLHPGIPTLESLQPPDLSLTSLADLEGTIALLQKTGVLP